MPQTTNFLKWMAYKIQILVDGEPLPLYRAPRNDVCNPRTTRYIEAQLGKSFAIGIERDDESQLCEDEALEFEFAFDDFSPEHSCSLHPGYFYCVVDTIPVYGPDRNTVNHFRPTFTHMLEAGSSAPTFGRTKRDVGKIEISLSRRKLVEQIEPDVTGANTPTNSKIKSGQSESSDSEPDLDKGLPQLLDEKAVKGSKVDRQVSFVPTEETTSRKEFEGSFDREVLKPYKGNKSRWQTVEFRYCSRAMLESLGIIRSAKQRGGRRPHHQVESGATSEVKAEPSMNTSPSTANPHISVNEPASNTTPAHPHTSGTQQPGPHTNVKAEDSSDDAWSKEYFTDIEDTEDSEVEVTLERPSRRVQTTEGVVDLTDD